MEIDIINKQIGKKIKDLRHQVGLTQQELADRTELTKGYISQLEHGLVAPSVITLLDLIECLGTTPSDFFKETEPEQVVFTDEGFFEKIDEGPLLVVLQPHQKLEKDTPHEGEEFGYVISGRIRLHLGEKYYVVKSGESFYYRADRSHYIENASAKPAKYIWVSTPPTF